MFGLWLAIWRAPAASAHPEDEICGPDSGLDPALCDALSGLERDGTGPLGGLIAAAREMGPLEALQAFFIEGWTHVFPDGLDHMLFIAALFISTPRLGLLIAQVSAFTLAHTLTVGLSAAGIIAPPPSLIEPLITASIAAVAIESFLFREPPRWRLAIVFGFGLIHGMGFARAFSLASADGDIFWPGLIGFNLGVEAAQLSVGLAIFTAAWLSLQAFKRAGHPEWHRQFVVLPVSLLLGLTGVTWTLDTLGFV